MSSLGPRRLLPALVLSALCVFLTPAAASAEPVEDGTLFLSARPRCKVSIDGHDHGTTDATRRGVKLPAGTYKVRFVCDDNKVCPNLRDKSGVKTLTVASGQHTRYLADLYALNGMGRSK